MPLARQSTGRSSGQSAKVKGTVRGAWYINTSADGFDVKGVTEVRKVFLPLGGSPTVRLRSPASPDRSEGEQRSFRAEACL